jgi:protein O-GlcNAc transferase
MRRFEGRGDGTMRQVCLALMCGFLLVVPGLTLADEGMAEGSALDPLGQSTDYEIGYDLLKAGRFLQAIEAFEKVIAADPTHAMAYTNMAYSFRRMGQYERAIQLYRKALDLQPDLAEAHEYMGEALLTVGKVSEAKSHLAILEGLDAALAEELRAKITRHDNS